MLVKGATGQNLHNVAHTLATQMTAQMSWHVEDFIVITKAHLDQRKIKSWIISKESLEEMILDIQQEAIPHKCWTNWPLEPAHKDFDAQCQSSGNFIQLLPLFEFYMRLLQNLVHTRTAVLLWHVQNFERIWSSEGQELNKQ